MAGPLLIPSGQVDNVSCQCTNGALAYQLQSVFWVDAQAGNDAFDALTSATAIKTTEELARRITGRVLPQLTTIHLIGTFTDGPAISCVSPYGSGIVLTGDTVTQLGSGTLTAVTAYNYATNVRETVTDAAQNWATKVKAWIRMTSGAANGAVAIICKDQGAGVAEVNEFVDPNTGFRVAPATGNYVIETPATTVSAPLSVDIVGGGTFLGKDLSFSAPNGVELIHSIQAEGVTASIFTPPGQAVLQRCKFTTPSTGTQRFFSSNFAIPVCVFDADTRLTSTAIEDYASANFGFMGAQNNASWTIQVTHRAQGTSIGSFNNSIINLGLDGNFFSAGLAIFDNGLGNSCLQLDSFGYFEASVAGGIIFGAGNTVASNVLVRSGCSLVYVTKPVITGTGADSTVGGTNKAWGAIPFVNAANNAMIVARA